MNTGKRIAIVGAGPSGLFMYKRLIESKVLPSSIDIFESNKNLGVGMPYSHEGANVEHITNVSSYEIPELVTSIEDWIYTLPESILAKFDIDLTTFSDHKVLPRLLFGKYLSAQFELLIRKAEKINLKTIVKINALVVDIIDKPENDQVEIIDSGYNRYTYDHVIICTGHKWPVKFEGKVTGYYDSPYPPSKLERKINHPIGIKGSSLTAIDAIRTLASNNGKFEEGPNGKLCYIISEECKDFKLVMHSRSGLLPTIRIHLEDPLLKNTALLSKDEIQFHMSENEGFLSLDFIFEKNFKNIFKSIDPYFYDRIKDMSLEKFVAWIMSSRGDLDPFQLFHAEYIEAQKSIEERKSIHWKEMLGVLSFAVNYPAKHLSAEDMIRLQKVLMPLISVVIAFVPQSSCNELLALYDAGKLELIAVGADSKLEIDKIEGVRYYHHQESCYYKTFIDCTGQPHFTFEEFPFKSMLDHNTIKPAKLKFQNEIIAREYLQNIPDRVDLGADGAYYLKVPGVSINDHFQVVGANNVDNPRIYLMAVPHIGGFNPDYSGLDFCAEASVAIANSLMVNGN